MSQQIHSCQVCKAEKAQIFLSCTDHFVSGEKFQIYKCSECGFVYTANAPDKTTIGKYYQSTNYISHSNTNKGLINKIYHLVRNFMLGRKYKLINSSVTGKQLLDIGCGTGFFPAYMQNKGYNVSAVEPDADARKFAHENFGLAVNSPEDLLSKAVSNEYNVITLWHVLEHLHEADNYMNWIRKALKADGLLIIAVPNCSSFDAKIYKSNWAAYDVPRHLWHFTPETLEQYMAGLGFKLRKIKRLPFDAFYNSMMSAKYAGKKIALAHGVFVGFISNLKSLFCPKRCSSVIYLFEKKGE